MVPPLHAALFPFKNGSWSVIVVTHFILQHLVANIKKLELKISESNQKQQIKPLDDSRDGGTPLSCSVEK